MTLRIKHMAILASVALPLWAAAQASQPGLALPDLPSASAPARAASAAPGPRLRSPAETGRSATAPGDLKPERPVAPQISIPFGKKAPGPTLREEGLVQRGSPAAATTVDDEAARCEAQVDPKMRADCRAKVAKSRQPN